MLWTKIFLILIMSKLYIPDTIFPQRNGGALTS